VEEQLMLSQNNWWASPDKSALGVISPTVAGVSFPQGVRSGDVATVLMWVAEQYHRTVEPLRAGECWGYYYREISGSATLSNHASATAIDLNAAAHPMGARGTFTAAQVAAIRAILAYCGGVVRWGGDYAGRPDEMHWEIVGTATSTAALAAKIRSEHTMPTADEIASAVVGATVTQPEQHWTPDRAPVADEDGTVYTGPLSGRLGPVVAANHVRLVAVRSQVTMLVGLVREVLARLDGQQPAPVVDVDTLAAALARPEVAAAIAAALDAPRQVYLTGTISTDSQAG
jgi:hypothetical protein